MGSVGGWVAAMTGACIYMCVCVCVFEGVVMEDVWGGRREGRWDREDFDGVGNKHSYYVLASKD